MNVSDFVCVGCCLYRLFIIAENFTSVNKEKSQQWNKIDFDGSLVDYIVVPNWQCWSYSF